VSEKMDKGWIQRGFVRATEDTQKWPQWMLREAGLSPSAEPSCQDSHHSHSRSRPVIPEPSPK